MNANKTEIFTSGLDPNESSAIASYGFSAGITPDQVSWPPTHEPQAQDL